MKIEQESGVNTGQVEQKSAIKLNTNIPTSEETAAITTFRNEFKISGQIGDSRQKDRLSFTSLKRGY